MTDTPDYLTAPDAHLNPVVAAAYDDPRDPMFGQPVTDAVALLTELAADQPAVEFAVGTGRIGLPLAQAGVRVHGIDFSEPMVAELRTKDTAGLVDVTVGDMTETLVRDDAGLVYLVYNTIMNLRSQQLQVACFRNAAAHLAPGGCFVIECMVPQLRRLAPGETIIPFDVSDHHLGFEEYVDLVEQISISHHYHVDGDRVRTNSPAFRYVWPSELDLMAELAGMTLESRWADWDRSPFTGESPSHVSVWRKRSS